MGLRDFTLDDVTARNARLHRDRTAFVFEGARTTHGEYRDRVDRTAAAFAGLGLQAGERVSVLADASQTLVDAFGAAARLGLILAPVNVRLAPEEVAAALADAEPRVVLIEPRYEALIAGGRGALPGVQRWLQVGPDGSADRLEALLGPGGSAPDATVGTDTACAMIYTAAVAGRPRGAVLSHGNLLASATQLGLNWRLGPDDVNLGLLPLYHVAGLLMMLAANHAGGASVLMPRFEAEAALRHIEAERATFFASFPPILGAMLDRAAERGETDVSSLRIVTGLESAETIARFEGMCPDARFWAAYGQAELSGLATMAPFRDRPGSAGRPSFGHEIAIVDDDRPVATGEAGDIVARGPAVFQGYWRDEAGTAATFRNGWHHTGDLGRFDADGYLWYTGRSPAKDLIKSGGENVYPAEVEGALRQHPAIAEAVVIGVADPTWGEAVKAVCVLAPGASATAAEAIDFVGERIARYKRPRMVVFVEALPKTSSGSVDRLRVKAEHGG